MPVFVQASARRNTKTGSGYCHKCGLMLLKDMINLVRMQHRVTYLVCQWLPVVLILLIQRGVFKPPAYPQPPPLAPRFIFSSTFASYSMPS